MMIRRSRWLEAGGLTAASLAAVLALASPSHAAEVSPSAYATKVGVSLLASQPVNVGPLAFADRDNPRASVVSAPLLSLGSVGLLESTVSIDPGTGAQVATADVASLEAAVAGVVLSARAVAAKCTAVPGQLPTGTTSTDAGRLGTSSLPVSPGPNTVLKVPGSGLGQPTLAKLVLNQQIWNRDGSLTVYAAHLTVNATSLGLASADLIVGAATCGPA